jgi:hypothetical protein
MELLDFLGFSVIVLGLLAATAKAVASLPRTFLEAAQQGGRFAEPAAPVAAHRPEPTAEDARLAA